MPDTSLSEPHYAPELSQASIASFQALLDKYHLRDFEPLFASHLEACLGIEVIGPDDLSQLGHSRLGGLPDLPLGWKWPLIHKQTQAGQMDLSMAFICQINLAEIADLPSPLPKQGLLYFFWDDYEEPRSGCVRYYPGPLTELTRLEAKDPARPPLLSEHVLGIPFEETLAARPHRLRLHGALSLPIYAELRRIFRGQLNLSEIEFEHYIAMGEELNGPWRHYLFGYHFCQQSLLDFGQPQDSNAARGITLLCINRDEHLGIDFLGYDQIHLMIARDHLSRQDFSDIYLSRETR